MKTLRKKLVQKQADLAGELHGLYEEAEAAVNAYNTAIAEAYDTYQAALVEAFDEHIDDLAFDALHEAESFRQEIADDLRSYYDDKSERWQEGDTGEQYAEWVEAWEEADFSLYTDLGPADTDAPEPLETPEVDWDGFSSLPDSP